MQLNEIIENNTLASISAKTRLSYENLDKLFQRDFSEFRKVQALGFISILEREYHADLSDVRAECEKYFGESNTSDISPTVFEAHRNPPHKPTLILDMSMGKKKRFPLKKVLVSLAVVVVLYGAWQTYVSGMQVDEGTLAQRGENVGFFSSIMHQAQSWMGGTSNHKPDNTNPVNDKSMDTSTGKEQQSGDPFVIAGASETPSAEENVSRGSGQLALEKQKDSTDTRNTPASTDEMQAIGDAIAAATDNATDTQEPLSAEVPSIADDTHVATDENSIIKEATQEALQAAIETKRRQEEAAQKQAAAEEAAQKKAAEEKALRLEKQAAQKQAAAEEAAQKKAAEEKAAKAAGVILIPKSKVWLGIVDLLTMKRSTKIGKDKVVFKNPKGGRWIVATGHGRIRFKMGKKEMKLNDGKKHFILIQNGTVKEIPHETFQKLNKSKVW